VVVFGFYNSDGCAGALAARGQEQEDQNDVKKCSSHAVAASKIAFFVIPVYKQNGSIILTVQMSLTLFSIIP
jgi:hypothetical protein